MEAQGSRFPPVLAWGAGIAIILFCTAGIAAIMGWIPTSMSRPNEGAALANVEDARAAPANPSPPRSRDVSQLRTAPAQAHSAPPQGQVANAVPDQRRCLECGVIESTREIESRGEGSGLGALGGAVVGGILGHQVGAGRGQDLATVVGAVGGVVAGNEIEKRAKSTKGYEVTVRLDDGSTRVIHEANAPTWRNGDHVRVVNGAIRAN